MKRAIIIVAIAAIVVIVGIVAYISITKSNQPEDQQPASQARQDGFDKTKYSTDEPGSLWWVVNKQHAMPQDYVPPELKVPDMKLRWAPIAESMHVSAQIVPQLEALYKASRDAGFDLMLISGYRSSQTQKELYDNYVSRYGQAEADRFSARPGTSEHQTGLAVDLGRSDKECELQDCFGNLPEGKWLAEHAHEYGFIIRYPKGKESIVGYMYEPWHLRYVGKELASELHKDGLTMEEFFGL